MKHKGGIYQQLLHGVPLLGAWYIILKLSGTIIKIHCSICSFPAITSQSTSKKTACEFLSPVVNVRLTTQLLTSSKIMAFSSLMFI